jgi:penicillin amidase
MRIDKIIASIFSLTIVIGAFVYFALSLSTRSIIENGKEHTTEYITLGSNIKRNTFGIPSIESENANDLYFTIGYSHAFDRLWQLDISRRKALGELSEILGNKYTYQDMFIRAFELEKISKESYENTSTEMKSILKSYTEGINYFIDIHKNRLPIEFAELNYKPEPWQEWHSYLVMKYLALKYSRALKTDIIMSNIAATEGLEKAIKLLPSIDEFNVAKIDKNLKEFYENNQIPFYQTDEEFLNTEFNENTGSVSWTVSNDSTFMMATDLHTSFDIPNNFYQAFIMHQNKLSFQVMVPGIPFGIANSNKETHWSIINGAFDDLDFIIEELKDDKYKTQDSLIKVKYVKDTIKIKNSKNKIYYRRFTDVSQIISDIQYDSIAINNFNINESMNNISSEEIIYTFNWSGKYPSDELKVLYELNNSFEIEKQEMIFEKWQSPPAVLISGSKNKTSKTYSGLIPNRKGNLPSVFPIPINEDYYEENDLKFNKTLSSENNFSVSTNELEDIFSNSKYGYLFDTKFLNLQIKFLLDQQYDLNSQNAKYLQNDQLSSFAQYFFNRLINQLSDYEEIMSEKEILILKILEKWDYIIQYDSPITIFYFDYIDMLVDNIFSDEIKSYNLSRYKTLPNILLSKLIQELLNEDSYFVDNKNTSDYENSKYQLFNSYRNTCKLFNINKNNLTYISDYKLPLFYPEHILSENSLITDYIDFKPNYLGGDFSSVRTIDKNTFNGNEIIIGPTFRLISNLKEGAIYTSILGGTSGDPVNQNFSDQIQLWLNGGYIKIKFDEIDDFENATTFKSN